MTKVIDSISKIALRAGNKMFEIWELVERPEMPIAMQLERGPVAKALQGGK